MVLELVKNYGLLRMELEKTFLVNSGSCMDIFSCFPFVDRNVPSYEKIEDIFRMPESVGIRSRRQLERTNPNVRHMVALLRAEFMSLSPLSKDATLRFMQRPLF